MKLQRRTLLTVISGFETVSTCLAQAMAGIAFIRLLVEEQRALFDELGTDNREKTVAEGDNP